MKNIIKTSLLSIFLIVFVTSCANSIYYSGMEKIGIHKRDIMIDRVEDVQDSQNDAKEEFKSALEQFEILVKIEDNELKQIYEKINSEYEDAKNAANSVSKNIDELEDVSQALFEEWENELDLYKNKDLRAKSKTKLDTTKIYYKKMMSSMRKSQRSMQPILDTLQDNVLILKHSLNAQAISSLKSEFNELKNDINKLIINMNKSIEESNNFIKHMD